MMNLFEFVASPAHHRGGEQVLRPSIGVSRRAATEGRADSRVLLAHFQIRGGAVSPSFLSLLIPQCEYGTV
jgi:hypothetical protein